MRVRRLRGWLARLVGLPKLGERDRELAEELESHLEMQIEENLRAGLSPREARRRALVKLGGVTQAREECRRGRGFPMIQDLWQDLRYGVRVLAKQPGFTAVAVLALALGIGVNAAILSAVNGFVLRPLPVEAPSELMSPYWGKKADAEAWHEFSYANYLDLREQNKTFSDLCAWDEVSAGVSSGEGRDARDDEHAEVVWGELVSANYFDVMGVRPMLGRAFLPEEDRTPNTHPVAVISHSVWRRRFGADAGVIGKTVYLNGQPFTVIGVMPESFLGSTFYLRYSFWAPSMMAQKFNRRAEWNTDRGYATVRLYGRLKPGVTAEQAEADLNSVAGSLAQLYPKENADTKIQIVTELEGRYQGATKYIRYGGLMALCISGLVLLMACANVANLMLARATTRAREIGIRLAIGASRGRIVRQLLTESVLLALLGGALGCAFAYWGAGLVQATVPPVPYPISLEFGLDGYALKWMLLVSLLTGVVFGLAPALLASRADLVTVIKGGAPQTSHGRRRLNPRGALVVAQVTISIVVLICAGLFIRSLGAALETDPGFSTENLVTMQINPKLLGYDQQAVWRLFPQIIRRIEALPGVRAAALTDDLPLQAGNLARGPIVKEGEADPPPNQGYVSDCSFVSPKYFDTVRTPLVLGRDFTEHDDADATPVVIVNQEFARKFYGGAEQAMGKRFRFAQGTPLMEVVGVAKDGLYRSLYEDRRPYMFLPVYQQSYAAVAVVISAQSAGALQTVTEGARREIAKLDPRLPVFGVMTAEENMTIAFWGPRLAAGMATTFGALALVLATMGLYSVMTYAVSQRTREIGIRVALGAQVLDVLRLVVSQGMRMVLIGMALGFVLAFLLSRALSSLLLGVGATDSVTFVGVAALLIAVALLACYIPARRAARVDPLVALRHE
jgi:predicted permease